MNAFPDYGYVEKIRNKKPLRIPDTFVNVVTTQLPELDYVKVVDVENIDDVFSVYANNGRMPNYYGRDSSEYRIRLHIEIKIKPRKSFKPVDEYKEKIDSLFKLTYPEFDFVLPPVIKVVHPSSEDYLREFFEVFRPV